MADVRHPQPVTLPDQAANDKSKVFTVALRKAPGGGLGLGILKDCGGPAETGSVRVHELYPGQPAQLCGRLRTGDVILKVNGIRLLGKSTAQALEILRAASGLVTLTVYRQQPEQNNDLSASRDQLNHCCRAAGDSDIAPKNGGYDPSWTTKIPRASSSSHDSSELNDSTPLPPKSSPLDAKPQLGCPLPRPRLRNKGQIEPQDGTTVRDLAGHCDFDVVTDGSVFGDLYNGTSHEDKPSRGDAAADEPAAGAAHCRRHKSVGALTAALRSSDNSCSTLDDDVLNGFTRRGSTAAVRSCFNSVMLTGGLGDDDVGLTRWRDSVLTEESDDSEVPHCSRALATEAGEAKLIDAPSLEIECVAVKLHRGWHTKLGFSLRDCDPDARDTPNSPVVKAVYAGSLASRDGRIRPGDFLVQVNGCDFIGCCAKDAVDYIRKCSGMLQLLFVRVHKSDSAPDQQ
ncbi:uncharacterized protein LOC119437006 isoform X1 [Dermacentor silvarum]|uniref:uncharacterized protein LOC119437006 isoform X1 n=1 Tax=Dermacentor silvarum TaxID=543639 RepID=UPI001898D012|nr:uncharacterized protein LOC119437006 isoform X1 [Dermacentor silvarum]